MKFVGQISVITILIATAYASSTRESRAQFVDADYKFSLSDLTTTTRPAGTIDPIDLSNFPALKDEGVSYSLFNIEPCGINLPHLHPRATEILYVFTGENITVAFVEENRGRTIVNTIGQGEATVFPQGLIHFQQNFGCERATYLSGLNHEDPGVVTINTQIATFDKVPLASTFGISQEEVLTLFANQGGSPAVGQQECLDRCAAQKRALCRKKRSL